MTRRTAASTCLSRVSRLLGDWLPLFVDATLVSLLNGNVLVRSGSPMKDGASLCDARRENSSNYYEVHETGLGHLRCLGAEVFGRWGDDLSTSCRKWCGKCAGGCHRACGLACRRPCRGVGGGFSAWPCRATWLGPILRRAGRDSIDHALEPPPARCDLAVGYVALSATRF